jgi:hypothetical protein
MLGPEVETEMNGFFPGVLILAALLLLNAGPAVAEAAHDYHYEPALSELSGRIIFQKYDDQGPPYWGEDKDPSTGRIITLPKVDVPVLILDRPIDVIATANSGPDEDSFYDVEIVEIDLPDKMERFVGQHVRATGYLYERTRGVEHTDVLFYPKAVAVESH